MEPNDEMKELSRELGRAINAIVTESERLGAVIAEARAAGFDFAVRLEANVKITRVAPERTVRILQSLQLAVEFDELAES
jgi:hypothetical protein